MKHEWRKAEKGLYIPGTKPAFVDVPAFSYFTIAGQGNPNERAFAERVEALYAAAYTVRMAHKSGFAPPDYFEYTVYPLEGVWDISDQAKLDYNGVIDKDTLVYTLMIRQPAFVTDAFAEEALDRALAKKGNALIGQIQFQVIEDGPSVQMLHKGSFDDEAVSFEVMETFCKDNNLTRASKQHREIYLSDFRKTEPENLKTTLRFQVLAG